MWPLTCVGLASQRRARPLTSDVCVQARRLSPHSLRCRVSSVSLNPSGSGSAHSLVLVFLSPAPDSSSWSVFQPDIIISASEGEHVTKLSSFLSSFPSQRWEDSGNQEKKIHQLDQQEALL